MPAASSLTTDVVMPQMGVSVVEGTVVAWRKQPGDWIEADETICDIETDKIDTEIPAPASGKVAELLVAVGETVSVGTPLARIETDATAVASPPPDGAGPQKAATAPPDEGAAQLPTPPPVTVGEAPAGAAYSPVVRRVAAELGVELATVRGTGRGGRVRKQDVLAAAGAGADGAVAAPGARLHIDSPYREEHGADGRTVTEPLSRMRRSIAEHMVRSLRTAATCTSIAEADFSAIEGIHARDGTGYLALVARAVIDALHEHSPLNATIDGESLTLHLDVNLGIAVSLGSDGLIVPVIARAHELSAEQLGDSIADVARRARAGKLDPDEVHGGTFTISNPGSLGTIAATPIIHQPQVAILDLEAIVRRPVVVVEADGSEAVAIRPMANLCLSWDHRAIDGMQAAAFLASVRQRIEGAGD